jgi:hypothetical protein
MVMRARLMAPALAAALTAAFPGVVGAAGIWQWNFTTDDGCGGAGQPACSSSDGNQRRWAGSGVGAPAVTANAWSNTTEVNGEPTTNPTVGDPSVREIAPAYLAYFGNNFIGVQNPDGGTGDSTEPSSPEHAMDNNQRYDSILFDFGQTVKLKEVGIGWSSTGDSDLSIYRYLGNSAPTLTGNKYSALAGVGPTNWEKVSYNLAGTGYFGVNAADAEGRWWLIASYVPNGGPSGVDAGDDYLKLKGLKADPANGAPEPGTLALLGIAALGFWRLRRAS